jgi:hypothetical protein
LLLLLSLLLLLPLLLLPLLPLLLLLLLLLPLLLLLAGEPCAPPHPLIPPSPASVLPHRQRQPSAALGGLQVSGPVRRLQ